MNEIKFSVDTKQRKQWFTGISFSHPAKMSLPLQIWLIENFTKPGEVILDPMAGSGTLLVACSLGRNVILVELENKFVDMMKGNWAKIQQRGSQMGYSMGRATILQGDARNLTGILVDKIITSPPYAEQVQGSRHSDHQPEQRKKRLIKAGYNPKDYQLGKGRNCEVVWEYGKEEGQVGNLPYGSIDAVISSPPYEEAMGKKHHSPRADKLAQEKSNPVTYTDKVDAVISSPPYEGSVSASTGGERDQSSARQREARLQSKGYDPAKYQGGVGRNLEVDFQYSKASENIGNLKSDSYLQAMLQVYQSCYTVLKDGGLMILVTKDFIRNKKRVDLAGDTIKLCEQAGFRFIDRTYRILTSVSFWRIIYKQRYPDAPEINREDILVFQK